MRVRRRSAADFQHRCQSTHEPLDVARPQRQQLVRPCADEARAGLDRDEPWEWSILCATPALVVRGIPDMAGFLPEEIASQRDDHVSLGEIVDQVEGPSDQLVTVYRGVERESYSCMPICQRRVTLGDGGEYFKATIDQAGSLNTTVTGQAAGAGKN